MPAPKSFLFVNKTADSKSLSNNRASGLSYTQINRQAQLVAKNRNKKPTKQKGQRSSCQVAARNETPSSTSTGPITPQPSPIQEEPRIIDLENEDSASDEETFGGPMANFDSICSAVVALDRTKQNVLEYFTTVWMPSKDHIPVGCQITGFAPVRPHDGEIAFHVVQGAFQTNDEVSMYALLSAGARRMQALHGKSLQRRDFPDLYTFKAIQALRKRIEKGEKASERLILDLSFLILAELFTPSRTRSEIYWNMIRCLIIQVGGLQNLTAFTAQIAMGFDHQISAGTLSKPALDPFAYTELLGYRLSGQTPRQESSHSVKLLLGQLDPRLRLIAIQSHGLTELIDSINQFPEQTVDGIRSCLRSHVKKLYSVIPEPLRQEDGREDAPDPKSSPNLIVADGMYLHARVGTWRTWTWFATLSFLPYGYSKPVVFPRSVVNELSQTWRSLDLILELLHGTGWIIRREVLVWIVAVGFFAASDEGDRMQYRRLLQKAAFTVDSSTPERLKSSLENLFPLDLMRSDVYVQLWRVMRGDGG